MESPFLYKLLADSKIWCYTKNINKEIKEIISQPLLLFWNPHSEESFIEPKLIYPSLSSNNRGKEQ